ncbi:MAG: MoaD/ThiS family protein [Kiritimatiellia bacterium]
MKVTVNHTAHLKLTGIEPGKSAEIETGASIADLLRKCGVQESHLQFVTPYVNGKEVRIHHVLQDGDELKLFLPVGGG